MTNTEYAETTVDVDRGDEMADYASYRSMSLWAVVSLVLGILGMPAIILPALLFLPAMGLASSWISLWQIRRASDEWSGRGIALSGLILSTLSLVVGSALWGTTYAMEVPEGYRRLSFAELKPRGEEKNTQIPSAILKLDGQRIFIKGYVLSSDKANDLKDFILVPDMGTCCFGGQPKLTDMIEVTLEDPLRTRYSWQRRKLGGVLHVDPSFKREDGSDGAHYKLSVDYLR